MPEEQRTFIAVKPDGVKRGLVGEIIKRFENKGFKLIGLKMLDVTQEMAEKHYGEHKGKPFYERLLRYIQSGPIVAMVWKGYNVIAGARHLMGKTNPMEALILWKAQKEKSQYTSNRKNFVMNTKTWQKVS